MPTTHLTAQEAAYQITRENARWGGSSFGQPVTVTYAFRTSDPTPNDPEDTPSFSMFNAAQIDAAVKAMQSWSDVARITFVQKFDFAGSPYTNNAAILFGNYNDSEDGASAFAYYPGNPSNFASAAGDVWVNMSRSTNQSLANGANPIGSYGMQTLVHEIGHAIGLEHPGDYNAGPDEVITYAANAEYIEDTRQYSVMSYFSETNAGGYYAGRYAAAPQLHDILAAQRLYGANMTTRTGDTVYGFNSNAERDWFVATSNSSRVIFAAWDAGGNDTFDFSGFTQAQTINLTPGVYSNVGGLTGNVVVAMGASIENAFGGSGPDTIIGTGAANVLVGNGGSDTINGAGGNDWLEGRSGNDWISGGSGHDRLDGGQGNDTLDGQSGIDAMIGGLGDDIFYVDDWLDDVFENIGEGIDTVYSLVDWVIRPNIENLILWGSGSTSAFGDAAANTLIGNEAANLLGGYEGNDWLEGRGGSDWLSGGTGADHLFGGDGVDALQGHTGADQLFGGGGADYFYFASFHDSNPAEGIDSVWDFQAGTDKLNLADVRLSPQDRIALIPVGGNTYLNVDLFGDGTQDMVIEIGGTTVSLNDIFF